MVKISSNIKKKIEQWKEIKLLNLIKRKRQKVRKLYFKFQKQDSILSRLLEEYHERYLS